MISVKWSLAIQPCNFHTNSFSLLFPPKTHLTISSTITTSFHSILKTLGRVGALALKKQKNEKNEVLVMEDYDDDDFEYSDDDAEDGEDDDEEAIVIPLENMKKWLENKPVGFGEGKSYDTKIEDKLFEEIEQSKVAQVANVNKLKHNPIPPKPKETQPKKEKAPEVIYSGVRVRLSNLPKKKNIHKNLQLAFKGVPGITNIVPAVAGNEKTRDPVCKGLAFVYLKTEQDANRFVEMFSRQSVAFGKIQKQIKCEIVKPQTVSEESAAMPSSNAKKMLPIIENDSATPDFIIPKFSSKISEHTMSNDSDILEDEAIAAKRENISENAESPGTSELNSGFKASTESSSPVAVKHKKSKSAEKKSVDQRKEVKAPMLTIPGSANRLKMKEKAVLTGVLSKYGEKAGSAARKG